MCTFFTRILPIGTEMILTKANQTNRLGLGKVTVRLTILEVSTTDRIKGNEFKISLCISYDDVEQSI